MTDEAPEPIPYRTDPAAGERFIKQHYAGIYRMLLHFTGSVETAEDLTQQVFVSAWQALPGFRGEARLSTWLRKIAYHEYTHWLRAQKLHASLEEASEVPDLRNAAGLHTIMLRAALRALPLELSESFLLFHVHQLSVREVAVVMEVPEGTVKSRLHAARLRIRDLMSEPAGAAHAEIMEPGPRSEGTTQSEITTAQTLIPTGPAAEGASIQPTS